MSASAAQAWLIFAMSTLFTAACCIAACIAAERAAATDLPGPGQPWRSAPSRAGEQFLAAPVMSDETILDGTVIMPGMAFAVWAMRAPVDAYRWQALERQREWLAAAAAKAARDSGRRIAEGIRSRRAVAARADLIAAIRESYAAVTVEGTWDDLVAAIRAVVRSAA